MATIPEESSRGPGRRLGRTASPTTLITLIVGAVCAAAAALAVAVDYRRGVDGRSARADAAPSVASTTSEPRWPSPAVALMPLTPPATGLGRPIRIYLDAGHGAAGNSGNVSASCEPEQDFTRRTAGELATRLATADDFVARASRVGPALSSYATRLDEARDWRADLFVSIHSDVRGQWLVPEGDAAPTCPASAEEPGFAVLWSDEGEDMLVAARLAFARALGWRLEQVGLPAYDGAGYRGMYEPDTEQPGVFLDRHPAGKRIFVLRAAELPSVILETHNAWHPGEVARWNEAPTIDAVATAIMAAAADWARLTAGSLEQPVP